MEYNTGRSKLTIPEYGRNVQQMALHLLEIKDRKERNRAAQTVIQTMTQVHPYAKDSEELRRKLWDHLYIITSYKLDVDGPYPKPEHGLLESKPKMLKYPSSRIKFKHYGKIAEGLIKKAQEYKDGAEKDALVESIAAVMKKSYMVWNQSSVNDNIIVNDLGELSGGKLQLKDTTKLSTIQVSLAPKPGNNFSRNNKNKKKGNKKKKYRNGGF
ncbi:MAG TPA: DUF4290 domain-containing protein [Bacteroidia bacterium]|nr:DUF4290 domain-containing protein [Bacteroidia bacterium]